MARPKSTSPRSPLSARVREIDRTLIACFALAWIFAFAFMMGDGWPTQTLRQIFLGKTAVAADTRESDDALATGSIVFVPTRGDTCRQSLIDNTTWRISPLGDVSCATALSQESTRHSEASRLDVVRNSFRNK